jgi:hypothetical protein
MNDLRRRFGLALAALLLAAGLGFAQSGTAKKPLSEAALLKLVKSDLEEEVIVTLIKKRGIAFKADDEALARLKENGAAASVLAAVRAAGGKEKPDAEVPDAEDTPQVLAKAEHESGLMVEVTEVKPDADRPLLTIKWRYRNPTKRTIQLIKEQSPFVVPARTSDRWTFIHEIYFLAGDPKDDEKQFRHPVVNDTGGKSWCKPFGKGAVRIGPDRTWDFWAKFELPERTTKKISLQLEDVPIMESIPVQWGAKK